MFDQTKTKKKILIELTKIFFYIIFMQYGITDQKDPFTWKNYLVFMYVSQLGISSPKEPTLNWMRIVFWIISFLGYIILNLYQNYIGAFLAIPHFRPPVSGKDLFDRTHNPSHSTLYPDV